MPFYQRLTVGLVLALALVLGNFALWSLPNRPEVVAAPPDGRLQSVSFAPFRDGQSPLDLIYPSREQIEQDLAALKDQVAGVRTYSSLEGLEAVPELARKYGLKVTLGAWLGSDLAVNRQEIASAIQLANAYPDVVTRVIVGNEVLLRNDLKPDQLVSYIRQVRGAIKQPVGYADVWEYWLKHPALAPEVDFITIHLLPYWEDQPIAVDQAADHVLQTYNQVAQRYPGKPILVGETGWPTQGRARGPATPSLVNKLHFLSAFVHVAQQHHFDYNVIEAFDQSWKIRLEGTVGGYWGLYGADRQPKSALSGPIVEDVSWPLKAGLASLLAGLALLLVLGSAPGLGLGGLALSGLLLQGLASGLVLAASTVLDLAYYVREVAFGWGLIGLELAAGVALVAATVAALTPGGQTRAPAWTRAAAGWGPRVWDGLTLVALGWGLLMVLDGRYRCFPDPHLLGPALGLALVSLVRLWQRPAGMPWWQAPAIATLFGPGAPARAWPRLDLLVGLTLVWSAIAATAFDGLANHQALLWSIIQLLLAWPYLAGARDGGKDQRN